MRNFPQILISYSGPRAAIFFWPGRSNGTTMGEQRRGVSCLEDLLGIGFDNANAGVPRIIRHAAVDH